MTILQSRVNQCNVNRHLFNTCSRRPLKEFHTMTHKWQGLLNKLAQQKCFFHSSLLHGPGDSVTHVSCSSMVALQTLLSCAMHVAYSNVICYSLQSSLIMLIHRFLVSLSSLFHRRIAVVCYMYIGVFFILLPIQVSKVSQSLVLESVDYAASD